ncbi:unnamed protein product [Acanthoscelides obtectus]|uniref:Uncharacterized protein n=1 Tax=Acanthoscelides obtectus TaxID=200917 RepID=A0A9P0PR08_ACAOB|nr:unnamed protein product [Acanthoscelides obtectus]CAK1656558.1 hypothetical protein AOBTE_LOCUS19801 [Acanthoscelides obtectus]
MNPATVVLFSCIAIIARGAVIVDPTAAAIALNAGFSSRPFGIGRLAGGAGGLFNLIGSNSCIGGACFSSTASNCVGAECLVEDEIRKVEVQKQLQKQLEIQNAQFMQQQQILNEQQRLQQERILTQEAKLTQQAIEEQAMLEEQRALVDVAQKMQRAQLLEQLKTARMNQVVNNGLWNTMDKSCGPEGCLFTGSRFFKPVAAGIF